MSKVRTRFAPSPTGFLHIGGARTAFFSFLYAKKLGGEMILRIEDTDKERSEKKYEEDILSGLDWLQIGYSEIFRQSERADRHSSLLKKLIDENKAYLSKGERGERKEVIRLRNNGGEVVFNDLIRGEIKTDVRDLGDFVVAKSLEEPVFHFANVADDGDMKISHIIRGEDHISNTPRQILISEALGFARPQYAHIPLILAPDKSKLSKRHGAVSVIQYKKMGYLPEAMINYLAFLGWNPGDDREILSLKELIEEFSLEKIHKGGAVFNVEKLNWVNKQYINRLSENEYLKIAEDYVPEKYKNNAPDYSPSLKKLLLFYKTSIVKFEGLKELFDSGELRWFFGLNEKDITSEKIVWKNDENKATKRHLKEIVFRLKNLEDFSSENVKAEIQPLADERGRASVLHPMRFSLSGRDRSPDPFSMAGLLGKEETIKRLNRAIKLLS
ncbi:glutamate--tRNA ligase [Candidatus Campbellbacteria bacterium CG11_big_fil_rev_8_21_14_0_20_44_21]|uniref:Glutamate--tRNA ligase n=1 Tax=Candidatus Campbellbacteria bacterium CG22_combo_CG10-13_8_21_14_all_43_18 TaxID=1974530 RepID=A0A2H0DX86_9BACT|nr:MAG: glutamate--tRNA ligase [Candidatus Campbellbacteria bacterium CG22_combo_CG10-13_8_21_14_all_43_18]PIR24376.1 MAG: glutamate--tRNA ligase [Candidatus Campbellbacteria bacterium CG11_big_fil_rev_8_21_14_0_20_44_21]